MAGQWDERKVKLKHELLQKLGNDVSDLCLDYTQDAPRCFLCDQSLIHWSQSKDFSAKTRGERYNEMDDQPDGRDEPIVLLMSKLNYARIYCSDNPEGCWACLSCNIIMLGCDRCTGVKPFSGGTRERNRQSSEYRSKVSNTVFCQLTACRRRSLLRLSADLRLIALEHPANYSLDPYTWSASDWPVWKCPRCQFQYTLKHDND